MNNRETRKCNLVLHGLPEPEMLGAASKEAIYAEEKENLNGLLTKMSLNVDEVNGSIKFRKRLGEKQLNKSRPLLIGFTGSDKRSDVMTASKTANIRNISFKPDLTKMQREENTKLVLEVQELNAKKPSDDSGDYRWKLVGPLET